MHIRSIFSSLDLIYILSQESKLFMYEKKLLTFSQRGSIKVNKSRLFAFRSETSAPPAFPKIISPAFFEATMATSSKVSRVSAGGRSSPSLSSAVDDESMMSVFIRGDLIGNDDIGVEIIAGLLNVVDGLNAAA